MRVDQSRTGLLLSFLAIPMNKTKANGAAMPISMKSRILKSTKAERKIIMIPLKDSVLPFFSMENVSKISKLKAAKIKVSFEIPEHQNATVGMNSVAASNTQCLQKLKSLTNSYNFHEQRPAMVEQIKVSAM